MARYNVKVMGVGIVLGGWVQCKGEGVGIVLGGWVQCKGEGDRYRY